MPSSIKRAEEYGDDLTVLFVEVSSKRSMDYVEAFAYRKHWMGTPAMWTKERPFPSGRKSIPAFVLLSAEGEVLLRGNPMRMKRELDEAIANEIEGATDAPDELPRSLKKAWKESGKGKYVAALKEAQKVRDKAGTDAPAATALMERIEARIQADLQDARWCLENGYLVTAEDQIDDLARVLAKSPAHSEALEELRVAFEEQPKEEFNAAKALAKIQTKLYKDGLTDKLVRELERVVKRHAGTRSAARATHLASLAD